MFILFFGLIFINSFKEKYVQKKYTGRFLHQDKCVKMKLVG